jgi:hypothetical protein
MRTRRSRRTERRITGRPELPARALSGDLREAKKTPDAIREVTMCKTSSHSVSGRRPSKAPPVKTPSMKSSRWATPSARVYALAAVGFQ